MEVFPRSDLLLIPAAVTEDETVQYPEAVALGVAPGLRPRRREVIPVRKRVCPFLVREDPRMRGSGENRMPEPRAVACCQALPSVTRSLLEGGRERNLDQGLAAEPLDNCGFKAAVGQDVARLILQLRERPNAPRGNEPLRGGEAVDALLGIDDRIRSASWMQSTGQTSTQERSLMSMQGSAMMYVTAAYSTGAVSSSTSCGARSWSAFLTTT